MIPHPLENRDNSDNMPSLAAWQGICLSFLRRLAVVYKMDTAFCTHQHIKKERMPGQPPPVDTPARALRLHGTIARKLGIAIVSGQYAPGDLLDSEIEASEQFAVSRTAYREGGRILAG